MKKIVYVIILLVLSSLPYGCWDRVEINEIALVVGTTADYTELEGGKTGVKVTAQVANPAVMAGAHGGATGGAGGAGGGVGTGESKAFWTITETGQTIREAISKMDYTVPEQLFFGHARVQLFGERAARAGIYPFLDRLVRSRQSRENDFIAVTKGDPGRILEQESPLFMATSLALDDIFRNKDGREAIMAVNHADFDYRISTGITCPVAPVVEIVPHTSLSSTERESGRARNTIAVSGLAAFDRDGRLVDYFNERETKGLLWVLNRAKRQVLTIPYFVDGAEEPVSLRQVNAKSKIGVSIGEDGLPSFEIKLRVSFDVLEHFGIHQGLSDVDFISNLEDMACGQIINEIEAAVIKSQQINTDVFGFGEEVRRKHRRDWQRYKDQWRDIFPEVKVTVDCQTQIRDRELTVEPPASHKEGAGQ